MKFTVLGCGTSTGVPIPACQCKVCSSDNPKNQRTRTSALITLDDSANILIDTGPDLRFQALRSKIRKLDAVLFTHAHADHIMGLDDLRGFNFAKNAMPITCFGTHETFQVLEKAFSYVFHPTHDYEGGLVPQVEYLEIENGIPFNAAGLTIEPFPLWHGSMEVTGFKIGELAYATDCNKIPDETAKLLKGIKHLIIDGLQNKHHRTHFTILDAVETAKSLGAEYTYLIHMTHSIDYDEVSSILPANAYLCYDGMEIEFKGS